MKRYRIYTRLVKPDGRKSKWSCVHRPIDEIEAEDMYIAELKYFNVIGRNLVDKIYYIDIYNDVLHIILNDSRTIEIKSEEII